MRLRWQKFGIVGLVILMMISLSACGNQASSKPKRQLNDDPAQDTQFLMGTVVNIKIYDKGKSKVLPKAFDLIKKEADEITVNQKGSEIDKINNNAGIKPVKVSDDVFELIQYANYFSKNSNGSFDMAIGPITSLWHIGFDDARKPSQAEIDARLPLVNYKNVTLNRKQHTVYLQKKGMQLDLGGIAKGYITDQVKNLLQKNGVTTAIIDLGGNVFVMGNSPKSAKTKWTVGIQDPKKSRGTSIGTVEEANRSIVTSGIYERYLKVDGHIYMHLMNPKTGYPFDNNLMGVSIVSRKSVDGDALSTATFDKGLKDGMSYINAKKGAEAIFITKDKKVYVSKGLKENFKLLPNSGYKMGKASDYK